MLYFEKFATVEDVINFKQAETPYRNGVLQVPLTATLLQLISFMSDYQVGVVFLYDGQKGNIISLISERDIMRHIALNELAAFEMPINNLGTREIFTCSPADKLKAVAGEMAEHHIRHAAILGEEGDYIGVISSSDIELFAGQG